MGWLGEIDWAQVFLPDTPLLEIFVRGTLMYIGILVLLRVIGRREVGMIGLADVLMIVLLSDAAQNGMAADYHSVTDGLFLISVIIFWNEVIDRATYRFPRLARLMHPPALPLIEDGRMLRKNMRKEFISYDELCSRLRAAGVEKVDEVRRAYLEANGEISVIRKDGGEIDEARKGTP
jgi:uncharacterized membrane protein YcaP (DUF421 family)